MGIDTAAKKVQINKLVRSQVPSFVAEDNPLFVDFLKQYYISEESKGKSIDIITNFNDYQKADTYSENYNLIGFTTCTSLVNSYDATINVSSTDGWPSDYGLLKIDDEIITYTGITSTSFTGCVRGFCGVDNLKSPTNPESLVFSTSNASKHENESKVINLSNLFLQEFWHKTKELFMPGFEDRNLHSKVDKANFLRQAKDFYASKGTDQAIKILFGVLFDSRAEVIKPIEYLFAPSDADYVKTNDLIVERLSGNADNVVGQTLFQTDNIATSGSILSVQYFPREGRNYYILSLSKGSIVGTFEPTGSSSLINPVSIGTTVITVDSTLGFPESGELYVGAGLTVGIATYTSKTSTQFYGVSGISSSYTDSDFVRSSKTVFAYENGDVNKPVFFRLTNVANGVDLSDVGFLKSDDIVVPRQLGKVSDKTNYHLNSWIDNVKTKIDVARDIRTNTSKVNDNSKVVTTAAPHGLQIDDSVVLLDVTNDDQNPDNIFGTVLDVYNDLEFFIAINSGAFNTSKLYKVQRQLNFANSTNNQLGIENFVADVQNTYITRDNKVVYVTAGSLPSYEIVATNRSKTFISADPELNSNVDGVTNNITIVRHNFTNGELVEYSPVNETTVVGLDTGSIYAVKKINDDVIQLSRSVPDVAAGKVISIVGVGTSTTHTLVPSDLAGKNVRHQNFLRKFPVSPEPSEFDAPLQNEPIGMFLNGVEILSNKSGDSIHFGTIDRIDVESGGNDYDVITPPNIHISDNVGTGATAYAVIEGDFKGIDVISGGYDLKSVPNVVITGGNGQGATAKARLKATRNSRLFDAKDNVVLAPNNVGGNIIFPSNHLFFDGESVVYEKSTADPVVGGLVDKSIYFVNKISDTQISLMNTVEDAVAGINSVSFTGRSKGSHKLTSTVFRNVLERIIVDNPGSGYSNRKVLVNSNTYPAASYFARDTVKTGINTANNYIYFRNHGFKSGETVEYTNTGTPISGLDTTQNYQVIVLDENKFRVCSAGIGATTTTVNYFKGRYVDLNSIGAGTHTFKYPDISVSLQTTSGLAVTAISAPVIRPRCHGSITDVYLTNDGVGYGSSDTINAHRRPLVTISNGQDALITVGINNGEINRASVKIKGKGYVSPPELIVEGEGKYANLLSNVASDGSISSVTIVDTGKGYTEQPATTVRVKQQGSGAVFRADLRQWNLTTLKRYQKYIDVADDGIIVPSQNPEYEAKFASVYLPRKLRLKLKDNIEIDGTGSLKELPNNKLDHSPIVGWAYDGAPIYGPYGFSTPTGGPIRRLVSSYTLNHKDNRSSLSDFALGSFIEDYDYTADGDLDKYNGRFCKTPEYPNGVYAYFCTIEEQDGSENPFNGTREPTFPYVLNGFKFKKVEMNGKPLSIQDMPLLNSGELLRNTLPYKLGFVGSDYDYLVSKNIDDTELLVKTIATSGIGSVKILSPGIDYKVKDRVSFNNSESGGRGASAKVRTLVGKGITEVTYNQTTVDHIAFDFKNGLGVGIASTCHALQNNDLVNISGIGTGEMRFLEGPRTIGVASITSTLGVGLTVRDLGGGHSVATGGTAFIKLTDVVGGRSKEDDIAVGDWLVIGNNEEKVKVLEIDTTLNRYKILRQTGIGQTYHEAGQRVAIDQRRFTFPIGINTNLNIIRNKLLVFDPQSSIGIGTTTIVQTVAGVGTVLSVRVKTNNGTILSEIGSDSGIGGTSKLMPPHEGQPGSNCSNLIRIPNHGLLTGQRLKYDSGTGTPLTVSSNVGMGGSFALTDGQFVFAVKRSNDLLGLSATRAGIGSTSTSLYFATIVDANLIDHSLETTNEEHIGSLDRYDVIVHTSEGHELRTNDQITVDIAPNTLVNKSIEYDPVARKTIVDPKYVNSSEVSTSDSTITLVNHGYKDGDKILYKAITTPIVPLEDRGEYYVKSVSRNTFRLFDNRKDSVSIPNAFINLTNVGSGVHRFARINPPIQALRGETIGFAVSDTSLADFKLEFYKDENFTNKFDGVGISTEIVRTGVSGASGSTVKVKLTDNIELPIWYKLVPFNLNTIDVTKRDSEPDKQVINGSKITIDPSVYAGNFGITTTGITSFTYQVPYKPEVTSYIGIGTEVGITTFRYLTSSRNATGGINEISIDFPGVDYIKNPGINTIRTVSGRDADIRMFDDYIGRAGYKEIVKIGYDYPTDKSLSPRADTPVTVTVQNNFAIASVGVETAGKNYSTAPDLFFPIRPNAETEVSIEGTGIGSIRILNDSLTGFDLVPNPPRIIPINNSNGVGVATASSNGVTNFITLKSPIGGWRPENHVKGTNFPFAVGDQIFVENVNVQGSPVIDPITGEQTFPNPVPSTDPRTYPENQITGYNSNMYDYRYFTVTSRNITDSRITYSILGIGTFGGFFDPVNSAGRIIKKEDLPTFNVTFEHRNFINGEPIVFGDGSAEGNIVKNEGWDPATNSFRLENLTRTPYIGDTITGKISRANGKVVQSKFYEKYFTLGFNAEREKGWEKNTGKPSNDIQKLQDSDYYQNFSYSIQSEVQEKDFTDAVDSLVHPSGYKNFSDLVVKSTPTAGFGRSTSLIARSPQQSTDLKVDIDNVQSFFVTNDFDFASETTISNGLSKNIIFQNKKLRSLQAVATAKVEIIDDISKEFNAKTETFNGNHIFKSATTNGITITSGGTGTLTATTGTSYEAYSGILTIETTTNHGLSSGDKVRLADNSIVFTCDKDNYSTLHPYPRSSDPASGVDLTVTPIFSATDTTLSVTSSTGFGLNDYLKIDNEILQITADVTSNNLTVIRGQLKTSFVSHSASSQITLIKAAGTTSTINQGDTFTNFSATLIVTSATGFNTNNYIKINDEILQITGKTNNTLTVTRGALGTFAVSHTDGSTVTLLTVQNNKTTINETRTFTVVTNTPIVGGQIVGISSFRLTSQNGAVPLFRKIFNPGDPLSRNISVDSDTITIFNHGFQTGEQITYDNHGNTSVGVKPSGVIPSTVFVVSRLDNNRFKIATSANGTPLEIRTLGTGTEHSFKTIKPENKTLIQVDGMIQSPLTNRSVNLNLLSQVGINSTSLKLDAGNNVGLTTVKLNDIIQIDDELFRVKTVGVGATNDVSVERGFLGTTKAAHAVNATPQMKGGNYRIENDVIFFATPPYGPTGPTGVGTQSTFSGRVFNRRDVTKNFVFDDISHKFTGQNNTAGKEFVLEQDGADVTGLIPTVTGTGGSDEVVNYGMILINGIFQRPKIDYELVHRLTSPSKVGAKIQFQGTNSFVNIPRGGKVDEVDPITLGQNYQPRVRAAATATVNGSGVITGVTMLGAGSGYFSGSVNIEVQNPLGTGTPAVLAATVGTGSSAGMITGINVTSGGSGYNAQFPPVIKVGIATGYTNLSVTGGSGSGLKVDALIGSGGSVIGFDIKDRGFGYQNGEVLTVQGIPFRVGVSTSPFTLTVKSTIDDKFAGFSFGQLVPLDDFSKEFNGIKKTFILTKTVLTKEVFDISSFDTSINVTNNLLIFINDILQHPERNYTLDGGSTLTFEEPPKEGSKLQVLFYRGSNQDIEVLNPPKTVKVGDKLQLLRDLDVPTQSDRVVSEITEVSEVETPSYGGGGISTNPSLVRVVSWKKQEKDLIVDGLPIAKDRPIQIGNFIPNARLIRTVGISSVTTYVDNAFPIFSAYDNRTSRNTIPDEIEIVNIQDINVATARANVSAGGTVSSITILDSGSGYENIPTVTVSNFNNISGVNVPLTQEVGRSWNKITAPADISYNDIDYIPEGVFVAVGSTSGIHTSTDGNNWTVSTTGNFGTFKGVVGLSSEVVVVGGGGTIARSTNAGSTFGITNIYQRTQVGFIPTYTPTNISNSLNAAAVGSYVFPNAITGIGTTVPHERVVVVGSSGIILYTEPGLGGLTTSFVITNQFANKDFNDVAYHDGTFIAVGAGDSLGSAIYRSTDGETWSGVTTTSIFANIKGITYGEDRWIGVGQSSLIISSSDDGLNWTTINYENGGRQLNGVHYQDDVWLAVGGAGMVMNSVDGSNWYKKPVTIAGSALGAQLNAVTYGDDKMVAVGIQSSLLWSGYEKVGAAATATVGAGGTISAITVTEGGFGYTPNTNPTVLLAQEVVTREKCNTVNVTGDYGTVVGVAVSSVGVGTTGIRSTLNLKLDSDTFLNEAGFGNISKSGLAVGDYFVIKNSVFGNGVVSVDAAGNNVGVGTSFADNIYKVEGINEDPTNSELVNVVCGINTISGITPITMSGPRHHRLKLGDYSFGKLTNLTRSTTDPKVFNINTNNGYTGITTAPIVRRISPLSITYSDFDQTS